MKHTQNSKVNRVLKFLATHCLIAFNWQFPRRVVWQGKGARGRCIDAICGFFFCIMTDNLKKKTKTKKIAEMQNFLVQYDPYYIFTQHHLFQGSHYWVINGLKCYGITNKYKGKNFYFGSISRFFPRYCFFTTFFTFSIKLSLISVT